jgi:hypothetical protein
LCIEHLLRNKTIKGNKITPFPVNYLVIQRFPKANSV